MRKTTSKRLICAALSMLLALGSAPMVMAADETAAVEQAQKGLQQVSENIATIPYAEYLSRNPGKRGTETVTVKAVDYVADLTTAEVSVEDNYLGKEGESLIIGDSGNVTWAVEVPAAGYYAIKIDYASVSEKTNSIERVLYINGKVPFTETRFLELKKHWESTYTETEDGELRFAKDANGNEMRPKAVLEHVWEEYSFSDPNTWYSNPFEYYLEKGVNTITLQSVRESMAVQNITVYPYEDKLTYEEYIAGKTEAVADPIHINAETPVATSDYTIYPIYDRKSAISEPQHSTEIRLNCIGSEKWQEPGQWVEYTFNVETAGLYEIVTRFRQNTVSGMYVTRRIYIDGEVPFEEANNCKFQYGSNWQVQPLNNGAENFQFYFEPGEHTIRFQVALGEMGPIVRDVTNVLNSINDDYLEILKLTGAVPDANRSYGFGRVMPHVVTDLVVQSIALNKVIDTITSAGDIKGENASTLENIARILQKMGTDEDEIAGNVTNLKSYVGTLGTWINTVSNQPVEIDYIQIQPASTELPRAEAGFVDAFLHEMKQFIGSFFTDYSSIATGTDAAEDAEKYIEVWVATGRDQAQIMRSLIDNKFIAETGINAEMKLVAGGTTLPSVLAGIGPDVSLEVGNSIEFAIRNAVIALNPEGYVDKPDDDEKTKEYNAKMREIFADFDEYTSARFNEAALVPLSLYGKTYGLPQSQSWNMMFYRTDILADLGLEVPKTWDDLMAMVPVLQFNNMEIGMPNDYKMFMYQMGGELWADDGMRINLDTNISLDAFESMCNMFTQYSLPVAYDATNRFKTGELPIFISGYLTYNNIVIFGTELAGLWDFGPIPGMMDEDGNINNVCLSSVDALEILTGANDVESSWEFLKWYCDTEFQIEYANEMVALLGDAGKSATANMNALAEMPWSSHEYEQLMAQMENLVSIPNYPGTYYVDRYITFAFNDAYNSGLDPVDSLLQNINVINKEISRKRTEFDLETLEIGQTLADKRIGQALEVIEDMDESVKNANAAALEAAISAMEAKDIELMKAAAAGLTSADEDIKQVVTYMTDAYNALISYIGK